MSETDERFWSKDIEKLGDEMKKASANRKTLETKILSLQEQSGEALLRHGSNSAEFQRIVKDLKQSKDELETQLIISVALEKALKQARKEQARKIDAQIFKRNQEILERYKAQPPSCPYCKNNKNTKLILIRPPNYDSPVNTTRISRLDFECEHGRVGAYAQGIRMAIFLDEEGKEMHEPRRV